MPLHPISQLALYFALSVLACAAPPSSDSAWTDYYRRSDETRQLDQDSLSAELAKAGLEEPIKAEKGKAFAFDERHPDAWHQSETARRIARNLRSFQSSNGGWNKNVDMTSEPRRPGQLYGPERRYNSTFDNTATTPQIRFLARSYRVNQDPADRAAVQAGLAFTLAAQYPNGGWPQIYPLAGSYHDAITYNDKAMIRALELLRDIAQGHPDFRWLDEETVAQARTALDRGVRCILETQIRVNGQPTGWCQQHDPKTLAPTSARAFEMVALSSKESSEILDFLVTLNPSDPAILESMEGVAAWLRSTAIDGQRIARDPEGGRILQPDASADPIWARFYEIGSNRPLFGDRDGSIHSDLSEISLERRTGYAWHVTDPYSALRRYEKWLRKREPN